MNGAYMENDLTLLPFDHYQRYATAARLLSLVDGDPSILEVGANRQRLLGEFLPGSRILYSDIEAQPQAEDFIVADASKLPLADESFDAVVSLDVLEHIPVPLRLPAVREMCRVAREMVVIGCPTDEHHVLEAEAAANACWNRHFPEPYPWLAEHEEFGLVDAASVNEVLQQAGLIAVDLGHGDPELWASLMGMHFLKEAYAELQPLSREIDVLYNRALFASDRPARSYRRFFVGVRTQQHADQLREVLAPNAIAPAMLGFLENLPESLQPLLGRLIRAESEWKRTAELLQDSSSTGPGTDAAAHIRAVEAEWKATAEKLRALEEDLRAERLAHHETGLKLRAEAESAVVQIRHAEQGWKESVDLARRLEVDLIEERSRSIDTMRRLQEVNASREALEERHDDARARIAALESDLCAEQDSSDVAWGELRRCQEQIHELADAVDERPREGRGTPVNLELAQAAGVERIRGALQAHRELRTRVARLHGVLIAAAVLLVLLSLVLIVNQLA